MAEHPKEAEVRIRLAFKDPFEIELHICLTCEAGVVSQDEQLEAI